MAAVGQIYRHGKVQREQIIARVTGADFDEVALAAEAVNGFKEKNFGVGHGGR